MNYKRFSLILALAGVALLPFPYINLLGLAALGLALVIFVLGKIKPAAPPDSH